MLSQWIVFQARKHEKAKRKSEKPVPCTQAVSVNPKLYEDGIDADVPQARFFAVGITNFSHLRQTMVLNNVTVSSDFENIVNIPPCFSTALSLWHYRFGIIALKCSLKTHFLKYCNILQATRHYNITSYSITYYLRATYASPHVESLASALEAVGRPPPVPSHRHRRSREPEPSESFQQFSQPRRSQVDGVGDPGSRSRTRAPAAPLSATAIRGSSGRKQFLPASLAFHLLSSFSCFVILERCFDLSLSFCADPFINYDLVSLFC